jgi:hypothetical protein
MQDVNAKIERVFGLRVAQVFVLALLVLLLAVKARLLFKNQYRQVFLPPKRPVRPYLRLSKIMTSSR